MTFILLFIAGVAIGLFYFGGLWLTVKKAVRVKRSELLLIISFIVRAGLSLVLFFILMNGYWLNAVMLLVGFIISRTVLIGRIRADMPQDDAVQEVTTGGN